MDPSAKLKLREFLRESLESAGDRHDFNDEHSLFVSGRLDSLAMTRVVLYLEQAFDIDFGEVDFDVDLIDSVDAILAFVDAEQARRV